MLGGKREKGRKIKGQAIMEEPFYNCYRGYLAVLGSNFISLFTGLSFQSFCPSTVPLLSARPRTRKL